MKNGHAPERNAATNIQLNYTKNDIKINSDSNLGCQPAMLYRDFIGAGIPITPLYAIVNGKCECGTETCLAAGKHPRMSNWQNSPLWADDRIANFEQAGWFDSGYGVVIPPGYLVVDIDPRNGGSDSYMRLTEVVPDLIYCQFSVNTGGGGKHMYYKVPMGISFVQHLTMYPGIDFKSSGFVVGPGSMHVSGKKYTLAVGSNPSDISDAPSELVAMLKRPDYKRIDTGGGRSVGISMSDIQSMMDGLPIYNDDYHYYLSIGMALHDATDGSSEGLELWDKWASKGGKYEQGDTDRRWHSFGKQSGDGITVATLYKYAIEAGWQQPVTFDWGGDSEAAADYLEQQERAEPAIEQTAGGGITLNGILGEYQREIHKSMIYPDWDLAGFSALANFDSFFSAGITCETTFGPMSLNSLSVVMAPTGFGKEALRGALTNALEALENGSFWAGAHSARVEPAFPASAQALHIAIHQATNHALTILADEFGLTLKRAQSDGAKSEALRYLMEIVTKPFGKIFPGRAVTCDYKEVQNPRLSLIGTTTAETMMPFMNRDQIDSGFWGRFLFFCAGTIPPKNWNREKHDLREIGSRIDRHLKEFSDIQVVTFTDEATELYKQIDSATFEPMKRNGALAGLCGRLSEQTCQIAAKLAISDGSKVIKPHHFQLAADIRLWLHERLVAILKTSDANFDGLHVTAGAAKQILDVLRKEENVNGVYESRFEHVSRKYRNLPVNDRKAVRNELSGSGLVRIEGKRWYLAATV